MILKTVIAASALIGAGFMASPPTVTAGAATSASTSIGDEVVRDTIQKYGLDIGQTDRQLGCELIEEGEDLCVYNCGGVWCIAECTDRYPKGF